MPWLVEPRCSPADPASPTVANHDTQNIVSSVAWLTQALFAENADDDYSGKYFISHQAGTPVNDTTWTTYCIEVLETDDVATTAGDKNGMSSHLEVDRLWPESLSSSFSDYTSCNLWYAYAAGVDDGPASTAHGPKTMPEGAGQSIRADPHCWCAGYGDRTLQQGESWNRTTHDVRWCKTTGGPFFVRAAALIFGFGRVSD